MSEVISTNAPRVLYLPNEMDFREEVGQVGVRAAFREMAGDGTISELKIHSFLADYYAKKKDKIIAHQTLLEIVRSFKPDILFWQHPSDFPIDKQLIDAIRACGNSPIIAYHEGDPFDRYYKRIHPEVATLYRESDVFFTIGLGASRRQFSEIREHPHFYYSPHCFDRERIGPAEPDLELVGTKYDAIMIGTIASSLKGFFKQPRSMERVKLARELTKIFGSRFAAFGRGWPEGTNSAGTIPFEKQAETIQSSRMSVIWELYSEYTFYFSDRLPIAIASGRPFVTNGRSGYDVVLQNAPGIYQVDSIDEALDVALYLRGMRLEEIASIGAAAREWAFANLEARVVFRRAFEICLKVWKTKRISAGGR